MFGDKAKDAMSHGGSFLHGMPPISSCYWRYRVLVVALIWTLNVNSMFKERIDATTAANQHPRFMLMLALCAIAQTTSARTPLGQTPSRNSNTPYRPGLPHTHRTKHSNIQTPPLHTRTIRVCLTLGPYSKAPYQSIVDSTLYRRAASHNHNVRATHNEASRRAQHS